MQPNEQNQQPNQPQATNVYQSPSGSDVPEYLHMDPIAAPGPKKSKVKHIMFSLFTLIVLVSIVAAALYWLLIVNSPQERFYRALEKTMGISYVSREYKIVTDDSAKATLLVDAKSDFSSQSSPKTSVEYELDNPRQKTIIEGEQIFLSGSLFYAKISQPNLSTNVKYTPNEWYALQLKGDGAVTFDGVKLRQVINTPVGFVTYGVQSPSVNAELVRSMKAANTYTVSKSETQTLDGSQMDTYYAKINTQELNKIIEEYSESTDQKVPGDLLAVSNMKSDVIFWVNQKTQLIQKISYSTNSGFGNPAYKAELTIGTINKPSIDAPDAKELK